MTEFLSGEVQSDQVLDVLNQIVDFGGNTEPAMREISRFMLSEVQLGFRQSRSPYGEVWAPVARPGQPLVDTRNLRNNISRQYGADFAEVGTNVEYAAIHQFGGNTGKNKATKITARPYLPIQGDDVVLPDMWEDEISAILTGILEQITNG